MSDNPTLAELQGRLSSLAGEARVLALHITHGTSDDPAVIEFAESWIRRLDELNRQWYENAARNGWASAINALEAAP